MADDEDPSEDFDLAQYILTGHELPLAEAKIFEVKLEADPNDLEARFSLLGYYFKRVTSGGIHTKRHAKLILWLVDNMPECRHVGEPWCFVEKETN
jgi:hypothetical protein